MINHSSNLKKNLKSFAVDYARFNRLPYKEFKTAIIFCGENALRSNFHPESYKSIVKNANWSERLKKTHPYFKNHKIKELQSSTSSDALLMNIFCHPKILKWKGLTNLINIDNLTEVKIEFGFDPRLEKYNETKTEIDMKIQNTIFEAKLTEYNFTTKNKIDLLKKYDNIEEYFDLTSLHKNNETITNYQLLRNFLAAIKNNFNFILLVDSRRPDLIREFLYTFSALKYQYQDINKFRFITWQDIYNVIGKDLKLFLKLKYGIC